MSASHDSDSPHACTGGRRVDVIVDLIDRALAEYDAAQTSDVGHVVPTPTAVVCDR